MNEGMVIDLFKEALYIIMTTSAPMLISALVIGLIIAVFQATTQIQEQTLAFVPKILIIFLALLVLGPWIMGTIVEFTERVFENIVIVIK